MPSAQSADTANPAPAKKKTMQPVNKAIQGAQPKPRRVRKHAGSDSSLDSIRSNDNTAIIDNLDRSQMHVHTQDSIDMGPQQDKVLPSTDSQTVLQSAAPVIAAAVAIEESN